MLLVKMIFGSHLYGTNTPESDKDYKGVFMPTKEEIILGRIPKAISETTKKGSEEKNTAEDIDTDIYSLHYFLDLACEGQTVALDMLHAPSRMIVESSPLWEELVSLREKFYTRNLKAFVGYCRKQAAKYGVKGSRLASVKEVRKFLKGKEGKLGDLWEELPQGEHLHFVDDHKSGLRMYQVCGKKFQETVSVEYVLPILERFTKEYGKRAKLAEQNEGIDWKAVSHALRAAYQTKSILTKGTIIFPLPEASFLKEVKKGMWNYTQNVAPVLEKLMDEVEELYAISRLPEKVDRDFWDKWLVEKVEGYYGW
jgi:hypothetical protein